MTGRDCPQTSGSICVKISGMGAPLSGWIGTMHRTGKPGNAGTGGGLNRVAVMARSRAVQDDILGEIALGWAHSGCIVGEIYADFLDTDEEEDIVATGRRQIKEDAPRYEALKDATKRALGVIEQRWNDLRGKEGSERARRIPEINRWYEALDPGHRSMANTLFGRLNKMPIDDDGDRRRLLIGGALAFESLMYRDALDVLERADVGCAEGLGALRDVLVRLDDLDASAYRQTAKGRLGVIGRLADVAGDGHMVRAVRKHLFDHLWLLDPPWERAAGAETMEAKVNRALSAAAGRENGGEGRLDIKYRTAAGKHIVIDLEGPGARVKTGDLVTQISKYERAVRQALRRAGKGDEPVEFVFIVNEDPAERGDPRGRDGSEQALAAYSARIAKYDELVRGARWAYREYAESGGGMSRVHDLVLSIGVDDRLMMRPPG